MRNQYGPLIGFLIFAVSSTAMSVDDGTKEAPPVDSGSGSVTYSTGGFGKISADNLRIDSDSELVFEDAITLVGTIGFRVPTLPSFGLELEFATAVIPGQITFRDCSTTAGGGGGGLLGGGGGGSTTNCSQDDAGDFGVNSITLYGTYRSPGQFYGMGKFGYGYAASNVDGLPEERNGTSWGLGIGYRWNLKRNNGVELVYADVNDVFTSQSLNFIYGFGGRD